jgi:exopolysaccharide biosynthesis predicted pyruvyltransferase EpsI
VGIGMQRHSGIRFAELWTPEAESLFRSLSNETVYYCPNPGNAGDSLIAEATLQLFAQYGVDIQLIGLDHIGPFDGKTVVFGGGGSLISGNDTASSFIERVRASATRTVLLPQSIDGHYDLLKTSGRNVTICCRDRVSYEYVCNAAPEAEVLLLHDLGFMLDVEKVLSARRSLFASYAALRPELTLRRVGRILYRTVQYRAVDRETLNAFRGDKEASALVLPSPNLDVSVLFGFGVKSIDVIGFSVAQLLEFINQFDAVHTNRLHVCIAATLLGKMVHFYPNSYWKNVEVYRHSIMGRIGNVCWLGADER